MALAWLPSTTASSTAVTLTLWATFQVEVVNVNVVRSRVAWASDASVTTTSAAGCVFRRTVKVSVRPPSATVVPPPLCVTTTLGMSLSAMLTLTAGTLRAW
jgi:hypothetical protein